MGYMRHHAIIVTSWDEALLNAQWNAVESGIIRWEIPSSPLTETADGKVTPASELPGGEG